MNKAQAIKKLARKLAISKDTDLTWAAFLTAIEAADQSDQRAMLAAVKAQNDRAIGNHCLKLIRSQNAALALTEAEAMLADDVLGLAELDAVL